MLSDREQESLFEIERRLLKDARLARCFEQNRRSRLAEQHRRVGAITTIVVGLVIRFTSVLGPRPRTNAEIFASASAGPRWSAAQRWGYDNRNDEIPFLEEWLDHSNTSLPSSARDELRGRRKGPAGTTCPRPRRGATRPRVRTLADTTREKARSNW